MKTKTPVANADIVVRASVSHVYAYPLSEKAKQAGFTDMRMREEYSDTIRQTVREYEKKGLVVDWSQDW
jgi:hypothetical protein